MTIAIATPPISLATSALQILLEALPDGQFAAWALALPDCRVVADSREGAIEALETRLEERRGAIEVIELPGVIAIPEEHPVMQFAGVFKDDPDFAEIVAAMRAERELEADNPAYTMDW
jgi:hypothetical protein